MRKAFRKNWIPKIVSLVLATVIWLLIRQFLVEQDKWRDWDEAEAPRARIPTQEELRQYEEEQLSNAVSRTIRGYFREQEQREREAAEAAKAAEAAQQEEVQEQEETQETE